MITYLNGVVAEKLLNDVALDVGGVGYGIKVSINDIAKLANNQPAKLHIYEHIREESHDLYGFLESSSKQLFEQLLSAKNVGPKVAMAVMNIGPESRVRSAIAGGDVKLLKSAKGVGKRAAEQIVVELRDKVGLVASQEAESLVSRGGIDTSDEAVQALISLGYSEDDAQNALESIDKNLSSEDRIKEALKGRS